MDIFGYPVTLLTAQDNTHKTKLSGTISIGLLIILLIIYKDSVINYLTKQNINATVTQAFNQNPPEILMTKDNFMFAISLTQTDYIFNQRPYFNVTVQQANYTVDKLGNKTKTLNYLLMEPCKLEKFQTIFGAYGQDFSLQYKQLKFDQWLCPTDDYQIRLGGTHANDLFEFLKIEISQCNNDTSDNLNITRAHSKIGLWNPICAPNESLSNISIFAFSIYTTDYVQYIQNIQVVNVQDPTNQFITPFLSDELYFNFYPEKLFKSVDIFYREQDVTTDQSIFYGRYFQLLMMSNIQTNTLIYKEYKDYNERVDVPKPDSYSVFFFRRSYFTIQSQRAYQQFQDLISYLGGFTGILLPLFAAFLQFYNRYDCKNLYSKQVVMNLANKIYNFDLNGDCNNKTAPMDLFKIPLSKCQESQNSILNQKQKTNDSGFVYDVPQNIFAKKDIQAKKDSTPNDMNASFETGYALAKSYQRGLASQYDATRLQINDNSIIEFNKNSDDDGFLVPNDKHHHSSPTHLKNKIQSITSRYQPLKKSQGISNRSDNMIEVNEIKEEVQEKNLPSIRPRKNLFQKVRAKLFVLTSIMRINKSRAVTIKMAFGKLFTNFKSIEYSVKWIINSLTCGICYNTRYIQLTNKAMYIFRFDYSREQIYQDLDVLTLIKKHQELIKLKTVILHQQQLLLINVQPKKLIQLDDEQAIDLHSLKNIAQKQKPNVQNRLEPEYLQIQEAYQWCLVELDKSDEQQYNINNKLIQALGSELQQDLAKIK